MSKDIVQEKIGELIESHCPIAQLAAVSRDIEIYGEVGKEEREKLETILISCKELANGIEELLEGSTL